MLLKPTSIKTISFFRDYQKTFTFVTFLSSNVVQFLQMQEFGAVLNFQFIYSEMSVIRYLASIVCLLQCLTKE